MFARRLIQVVGAQNIGLQNRAKRPFHRHAAQVNNGIDTLDHLVDGSGIGQIGQHHLFAHGGLAKGLHVRQAQHRTVGLQALAQGLAQAARGTGQQQLFMNFDRHLIVISCILSPVFMANTGLLFGVC